MVLESILDPKKAENKPVHVFVIAALYTLVAMLFAHFLFPDQSSILYVAIVTMLFIPFFQKMFAIEEKKEDYAASGRDNRNFIGRHAKAICSYSAFFFGVVIATAYAFVFFQNNGLFLLQSETLDRFASGGVTDGGNFHNFFTNNTQVLVLTFILSILFGSGAVLILAWNASVIGVFAGSFTKSLAPSAAAQTLGVPLALSSIATHGIVEIFAYFMAGLAGGILSVGAMHEKFGSRNFSVALKDALKMFALAELMIIAAAFIEAV